MNINLSLGVLSFAVWSAFSTWYYVNHIKDFESSVPVSKEETNDTGIVAETVSTIEASEVEVTKVELNLEKDFVFVKNTTDMISPAAFSNFYDSLQRVIGDTEVGVAIVGHACDLGSSDYNMKLSQRRAEVMKGLIEQGPFKVSSLTYKGEAEPLLPNTSESNRMKNRRVQLQFRTK